MAGGTEEIGLAAFGNHLRFIGSHRGTVHRGRDGIRVTSAAAGFSSWIPGDDDAAIPEDCEAVRLAPWSGPGWAGRLEAAGFRPAETLVYMHLPGVSLRSGNEAVAIGLARNANDARRFAAVQSAGFATGDAAVDAWWARYFVEMAEANVGDVDQSFYLGTLEGEAAGCTLVVRAAEVAGIYAVATRPEFRGRGVSAALLARVQQDAARDGCRALILQAMKGSYAEGYYRRLGFETLHDLTVWRKG